MLTVVGIRFKQAGKIYYFAPDNLKLGIGDGVIVETARGMEYGKVVIAPREVTDDAIVPPLKPVIRVATVKDLRQVEKNHRRETEAFDICLEKIAKHNLEMKLIHVDYTFDMSKIIFFFTADGRVDFRELVKDLAAIFRTRIELRQVGLRDEARVINGIGCCGRSLCCATFLGEFDPVSIRMAKEQGLSLNPTKISGVCGRLMCCLRYENDLYLSGELKGGCCQKRNTASEIKPPGIGRTVITEEGTGKVLRINNKNRTIKIQLDTGRNIDLPWAEVAEPENDD